MQTQGNKYNLTYRHSKPRCRFGRLHFVVTAFQCTFNFGMLTTASEDSCEHTRTELNISSLLACVLVSSTTRERYYNHFYTGTYGESVQCIEGTCHNFSIIHTPHAFPSCCLLLFSSLWLSVNHSNRQTSLLLVFIRF